MSNQSRERVVKAIENTDRKELLAWIYHHCILADPRGSHWGNVDGHARTVNDVLLELPRLNWRRIERVDNRTIFRATISGAYKGVALLRELPRATKVWIEEISIQGHPVRFSFGGEMTDVYLGCRPGYRALVWETQTAVGESFVKPLKEATIELYRWADGRETVSAVYPGCRNVAQSYIVPERKIEEGFATVRDAIKAGFKFALLAHQLVEGKPRLTTHQRLLVAESQHRINVAG